MKSKIQFILETLGKPEWKLFKLIELVEYNVSDGLIRDKAYRATIDHYVNLLHNALLIERTGTGMYKVRNTKLMQILSKLTSSDLRTMAYASVDIRVSILHKYLGAEYDKILLQYRMDTAIHRYAQCMNQLTNI
jgi:hypothetical protein